MELELDRLMEALPGLVLTGFPGGYICCAERASGRGESVMPKRALVSVVDDDESVRESLPDLLREFGYTARAFSSAEEFLASDCLGQTRCLILDTLCRARSGPDCNRNWRAD